MDRSIIYTQEVGRSFDMVEGAHDVLIGLAATAEDILGSTTTVVGGLAATAASPASLSISLAAGRVYQLEQADAVAVGAIPADGTLILQQGQAGAQTVTLTTSALTAGQSQWALIEVGFSQSDAVRTNDPNGGVLPYYDSANPTVAFQGPNNSGTVQNTVRQGVCTVKVVYGTPATTGSEAPPNADSGYVGLYLIDLTYGQTQVTQSEILVAGPSVGTGVPSNYPVAPFLAGLLNSHHDGNAGQAPKIKLTDGAEVQGMLPAAYVAMSLLGSTSNLKVVNGSTAASQMTASADSAVLVSSAGAPSYVSALNATCNILTNGLNGLDTGSVATDTWYDLRIISNGTTAGLLFTVNGDAPTYPSGYSYGLLIGTYYYGPSGFGTIVQRGAKVGVVTTAIGSSLSATTYTPITASSVIAPNAVGAWGLGDLNTAGIVLYIAPSGSGTAASPFEAQFQCSAGGGGSASAPLAPFYIPLVTAQTLVYRLGSAGTAGVFVTGYEMPGLLT